MKRIALAGILVAGIRASAAAPAKETLVFLAGKGRPPAAVTSADLRRIWLGQTTRWPDGRRIVLAVRPAATPAGSLFYDRIAGMNEIDFSRLWLGILFRGDAESAPRVIGPPEEVRRFLLRGPDGLAFLLSSEIDPRDPAPPIRIDGKEPGEPGYPCRFEAR
jgi:hypothetical protein